MNNQTEIDQIKSIVLNNKNRGNLPCILCKHHIENNGEIKSKIFSNFCGVNGLFAGCNNGCAINTMEQFISKGIVHCLECLNPITDDTIFDFGRDTDRNRYLYCSKECAETIPYIMFTCSHIQTNEFISNDRTQLYYADSPHIRYIRRTCVDCTKIIYPTDGKLHCFECKTVLQSEARTYIHKNGTIYLICVNCTDAIKHIDKDICKKCGLIGTNQCVKCKMCYCSRDCQLADWKDHKSACLHDTIK